MILENHPSHKVRESSKRESRIRNHNQRINHLLGGNQEVNESEENLGCPSIKEPSYEAIPLFQDGEEGLGDVEGAKRAAGGRNFTSVRPLGWNSLRGIQDERPEAKMSSARWASISLYSILAPPPRACGPKSPEGTGEPP